MIKPFGRWESFSVCDSHHILINAIPNRFRNTVQKTIIAGLLGSGAFPNESKKVKKSLDEFIGKVIDDQQPDDLSGCIPHSEWEKLYDYGFDTNEVECKEGDIWDLV